MKEIIARKYRLVVKTFGYIGWSLFWLLIWDVLVTIDFMLFLNSKFTLPLIPLTLLGSALVVLVSFRNSSAYNRWWEARTLWGALVNSSRSFARQTLTLIDDPDDGLNPIKATLLRRHIAYVNCLAAHLKGQACPDELMAFIPPGEFERRNRSNNFANDILSGSAALLAREYKAGRLDSIRLARLESTL
ncbi:effector protein, partial [Pseudomonas putida]